jgi:Tfp pilus assembly protein PilZ
MEVRQLVAIVKSPIMLKQLSEFFVHHPEIQIITHPSIESFRLWCPQQPIYSLIIEIPLYLKSTASEREYITQAEVSVPTFKFRLAPDSSEILGVHQEDSLLGKQCFEACLKKINATKTPYQVRSEKREKIIFNVSVQIGDRSAPVVLANSLNLSSGGIFILGHFDALLGTPVYLRINELSDPTEILCALRWMQSWGLNCKHLIGMGLQFMEMSENQKLELAQRLKNSY